MKLTIEQTCERDNNVILIPIVEDVELNEAYGDLIGICEADNVLWVDGSLNIGDEEVQNFIEEYFARPKLVNRFIRSCLAVRNEK